MSQPKEYRKLPGRGNRREGTFIVGTIRQSRLWLGRDHLLLVDSTLVSQDLKRFFFRDIQAITVRKTHTGRTVNIVMAVLTALMCWFGLLVNDDVGRGILFFIAAVFGLVLVINSIFGPTCECHLQTAVQRELLPSLVRLRTARKTLGLLRPHIEAAQGSLSADEARERATALAATPATPAPKRAAAQPDLHAYRGSFHSVLFVLLLVDGLLNFAAIFANSEWLSLLQMAVLFGVVLTLVAALIRQQDTDLHGSVRRVTWTTMGYLCALLLYGFVLHFTFAMQRPGEIQNEYTALKHFASLDPFEHVWLLVSFVILGVCSTILGIIGAVLMSRFNRDRNPVIAGAPVAVSPPSIKPPTLPPSFPPPPLAPAPLALPSLETTPPPPLSPPLAPPPLETPPPPAHG